MKYKELKKDIKNTIEKAEEIAIKNLSEGIEFSPYYIYGENSNKLKKLIAGNIEEALEIAEETIEEIDDDTETVVLIYKEKVKLNDGTFDAIVSQVYNIDEDSGYSFGLLYKYLNNKFEFLNERVFLGNIRNLFMFQINDYFIKRNKKAKKARDRYRKQELNKRAKEFLKNNPNATLEQAELAAKKSIKGKAALHNPDGVAGGKVNDITGMGNSRANSSTGSQCENKGIAENIEGQLKNTYGIPPKTIDDIPADDIMNIDLF